MATTTQLSFVVARPTGECAARDAPTGQLESGRTRRAALLTARCARADARVADYKDHPLLSGSAASSAARAAGAGRDRPVAYPQALPHSHWLSVSGSNAGAARAAVDCGGHQPSMIRRRARCCGPLGQRAAAAPAYQRGQVRPERDGRRGACAAAALWRLIPSVRARHASAPDVTRWHGRTRRNPCSPP